MTDTEIILEKWHSTDPNWKDFFAAKAEDGTHVCYINPSLLVTQKVTLEELQTIKTLHVIKREVFKLMDGSDDVAFLKASARAVKEIEFALQKNWRFDQNENFHEWYKVPKCTCPKMDNDDRKGTPYGVYNADCIIHGDTDGKESSKTGDPKNSHTA